MQGTYYPDLVQTFYYNYKFRDGVGFTKVKGVDIILDDDIWEHVAQFPINDGTSPILTTGIKGFNKIFAYRSFPRRPDQEIGRQLLAGPLKVDERLLHYLIVWILCPCGTNHAQCSEADLMFIYACSITFLSIGQALFLTQCSKPSDCLNIHSRILC